ncbi:MAG: hypothetical protein HQL54_06220 [Magnetococcales bacterium]|nr:hypothetical protein [Magnetococcales bacterium]
MAEKKKKSKKNTKNTLRKKRGPKTGYRALERKIDVLKAMMTLLEQGNDQIKFDALAKAVGLSVRELRYSFDSRKSVFLALVEYIEDHLMKPVTQVGLSEDNGLLKLRRLLAYHLRFLAEHPGLCRVFLVDSVVPDVAAERLRLMLRNYERDVEQIVKAAQARGEVSSEVPAVSVARMFVSILHSRALWIVHHDHRVPPAQEWHGLWVVFSRALQFGVAGS